MRNKRFIFTIDQDTSNYIDEIARSHSLSKSRAIKQIIENQKYELQNSNIKEVSVTEKFSIYSNLYSTPDTTKILNKPDFIDYISNEDADYLLFIIEDILTNQKNNDNLKLIYAKLLKHRGQLSEAIKVLNNINDNLNLDKQLVLLSILIQRGEISAANHLLIRCKEIINVLSIKDNNLLEQYYLLKSEFLWLNNGVSVAENFVDSLISNYENKANVLLVGKLYCLKAEFLRDKGSYSKAEENYKVSLKYFENFPSEGNYLARIFKGLGSVYKNKGDCKTSHDHLLIALNIVMKFGDKITEAGVLASLSGLYLTENKIDQGIKVLKEKAKIGENTGSLREKFYANYDLCLATIEKGDFKVASDIITENADGAKKFKREYYFKMWRGFLNTKKNLESGISIIKSSKIEALNAKEDKRVHLADYLIAASYNYHGVNSEKSKEIFSSLLNDPIVSKQLKNNVQYLIKYPKGIKSI